MKSERLQQFNHEMPELKVEEGYTTVEAVLGIHLGLCARSSASIFRETIKYEDRDIFISSNSNRVDAKSIMGLLTLGACCGTKIKVYVFGEDEEAKKIALRLYSGITTDSDLIPYFDRFEQ
jgi:phosphocarrier protein